MPLPTDPLLSSQWHLGNTGELYDLNVLDVWDPASGIAYTGAGIRVVVIDDGFDYLHPDLAPNYNIALDFDFSNSTVDAFGDPAESHGTAVAGIIGADNNATGTVGVAFDAELVGYRIDFEQSAFPTMFKDALHHAAVTALGDVVNVSLGFYPGSEFASGAGADQINTSAATAVSQGRGGLGTTIVKGAGNFREFDYDLNADLITNDTRQVIVAGVDQDGYVSDYSSYGAALLVSAFGTDFEVVTPDRVGADGQNNTDYRFFAGTSAATPMVSGVVALMYDANPGLGWRDVQSILAHSARHVGSEIGSGPAFDERYAWGWNEANTWNGGGLHFSNDYGYGLVDGLAAVRLAETWLFGMAAQTSANQVAAPLMNMLNVATAVPAGETGSTFTGNLTADFEVERVILGMTMATTAIGDVDLYVISPSGTVSQMLDSTGGDDDFDRGWLFQSQAFRGETGAGTWSVRVVDSQTGDALTVSSIVVQVLGRSTFEPSDRYVYTNEYSNYANVGGHGATVTDTGGSADTINAAAVSSSSFIDLNAGATSTIDGVATTIAVGTVIEHALGGDGDDTLVGNAAANSLAGMRGNDIISGGDGADTIDGGAGADTLAGGIGDDTYVVDNTSDTVTENFGEGTDAIRTTLSSFVLGANVENLVFTDGATHTGFGNALANIMAGGTGSDTLVAHTVAGLFAQEHDTLFGGDGSDTLYGEAADTLLGGAGVDVLQVINDFAMNLDLVAAGIEYVVSGFGDDTYTAAAGTTAIEVYGGGGVDSITGGSGNDRLWAGVGNDTLVGNGGNDLLVGDLGADSLSGGAGNDSLYIDSSDTFIDGGADADFAYIATGSGITINLATTNIEWIADFAGGNDTINGSGMSVALNVFAEGGTDNVTGGSGNDIVWGGSGNDTLTGNGGGDTLVGGTGSDTLRGDAGTDALYASNGGGGDGVLDTLVFTDGWGTDFVFDFEHNVDKLDLSAVTGVNTFADLTLTNTVDGHCYVTFGGNLIAVAGMAGQITQSDFLL